MAESEPRLKLGPGRSMWLRARKARSQLVFSRRCHRRLGGLHRCERRRQLQRRLLRAQAAGADWKEGAQLGACKPATRKHKASTPSPLPCRTPAPTPTPTPTPTAFSTPETKPPRLRRQCSRPVGPGRVVLTLPANQCFTFNGVCRVTCLYGQVELYGYTMSHGQPAQVVFSTYTHACVAINGLCYPMPEKSDKEIRREIRALLKPHLKLDDRHWVLEHMSPQCSVLLLEKLKSPIVNFISSYPGASYVFLQENPPMKIDYDYITLRSIGIRRQRKKKGIILSMSAFSALEELVSVSCEVDSCPVILVCGVQDIGKSTFNRYLINQLLNNISCVDYLECDLGQTEFTPPGCISLLNITEPVLGPPFCHQRTPQKMAYYGKTSCKNDCNNYIEIVKYVFSAYKRESPLIINTMGWVTDDGLLLLIDLIRLLSPSHVIQLSSPNSKYLPNLTPEYVDIMDGLYTKSKVKRRNRGFEIPQFGDNLEFTDEEKDSSPLFFTEHKLMCVDSEFICSKNPRNRDSYNRIFRDLAVLGYLSQLMPPLPKPLSPLHGLTPYQVPFSAVAVRIIHSDVAPTHILYALNASWVGLCKIVDDMRGYTRGPILLAQNPICDCLGFGICRGIDMEKRLYHILTPLPPEELRTVNCLLVGTVSIPQCVFTSQHGFEGTIPYITTDYNFKLPGASEKIGLRETNDDENKLYPKHRPYRKRK